MDSPLVEEVRIKSDGVNNDNNNDSNGVRQSVYDVLGATDQELARRQYSDEEADECDSDEAANDNIMRRKRLSAAASNNNTATKREDEEAAGNTEEDDDDDDLGRLTAAAVNGTNDRPRHDNDTYLNNNSMNGYGSSDCSYSPSNGNSNHCGEQERSKQQNHSDEPEQMRKLFIGGLDYKTSEASLKQHFERFGDVIDCVVMREPQSKRSRGFGFVIYASSTMVDKAQEARPHEVDGREVQSKRAISREDSGKRETQATVNKVYLGGLSDDIEESELRDYFKEFGNIVNVNIVSHKDTGKRRGFAFVEYDDYDPVDKIVLKKFHSIKDKRIEAKKGLPKVEMDARKRPDPRAAMAGPMMPFSGPPLEGPGGGRSRSSRNGNTCLWGGPYAGSYPSSYSSQANLDGYPPHYPSPSAHYGASSWMLHSGQGGSPYGFRGAHSNNPYGQSNYPNQPSAGWTSVVDYGGFPASQSGSSGSGGAGPMRLSYQHRSWGPYGSGYGTHRGRGYNP